jgi:hypothetical protein
LSRPFPPGHEQQRAKRYDPGPLRMFRHRCAECCGPLQSVKPRRQAVGKLQGRQG